MSYKNLSISESKKQYPQNIHDPLKSFSAVPKISKNSQIFSTPHGGYSVVGQHGKAAIFLRTQGQMICKCKTVNYVKHDSRRTIKLAKLGCILFSCIGFLKLQVLRSYDEMIQRVKLQGFRVFVSEFLWPVQKLEHVTISIDPIQMTYHFVESMQATAKLD